MPDPGWVRDPSGRYAQRYFDGTRWTEHVADEYGRRSTDPVENAQRQVLPPVAQSAPPAAAPPSSAWSSYQPPAHTPAPSTAATPTTSDPDLDISARSIVGVVGGLVALIGIIACPWFEDLRIARLGGSGTTSLVKATYFETGWIVSIVAVLLAVAAAVRTRATAPRWLASIPVGLCAIWAVVGTLTLKSDLPGVSFGFGFFVTVVGLVATAVAPLLPGSSPRA